MNYTAHNKRLISFQRAFTDDYRAHNRTIQVTGTLLKIKGSTSMPQSMLFDDAGLSDKKKEKLTRSTATP